MNTLLILLALTKSQATIEIISLLLVAGIIGYVTAWLYTKSVYEKKIIAVESDKHELNNRIVNLDGIIVDLNKELEIREEEIEHLELEVKSLKALHAEAVHETDDITLKNKRNEQTRGKRRKARTRE